MRSLMLVAMLVPLLLLVGCSKRNAKKPAPSNDKSASVRPEPPPQPPATDANKKDKDAPNWLNDPRWKKEQPKTDDPEHAQGDPLKKGWGIAPPQGGWQGPKAGAPGLQPTPVGPGPGAPNPQGVGVLQPQPASPPTGGSPAFPAKRVELADMKEVWVYIENRSGASGKMPPPVEVYVALVKAESPAADLVKSGAIILTGAAQREGVWAYEARARLQGGLVASQNGVETLTADELNRRLGR